MGEIKGLHKKKIHRELRKNIPYGVHKAKKIFSFKYPKLLLLAIIIFLSYNIFSSEAVSEWIISFSRFGNLGIFFSGILSVFGFTAPLGIGFLIKIESENIFLGTLIGGVGAMIGDLIIFKTIKFSFMDEFRQLEKTGAIQRIRNIVKKNKHVLIKHYLLYIFAGIVIATPLPDELGVSMLAGLTTIKQSKMALIAFILHSIAMFLILKFI
jgi:uncharacterized membrane protein YdjX (TVP38/TMEM64 family)